MENRPPRFRDEEKDIQPVIHTSEVADVAPIDGIGVMAEVIVGELLPPFQFGVHRVLRDLIDDEHMNALFDQEVKLFIEHFRNCRRGSVVLQSAFP